MNKRVLILMGFLLPILTYADDQYIFEKTNIEQTKPGMLEQPVTVRKSFRDINLVVSKLNLLGLSASVKTSNQVEIQNAFITSNGTVRDFINVAAEKFNYAVNINGNKVVFSANNPNVPNLTTLDATSLVSSPTTQIWSLDPKDKTLRNTLTKWSKKEGWQLVWNVKADYPITTSWNIPGTFEVAVNEILKASQSTDTPLQAVMHDSNHVLEMYSPVTSK
ncbi:MAG: hypothetical protein K0R14_222 [Burkholderiales bacterium]|jgi:hypothetical protein|nr:hypothetical protein [Burkholderiales bacterium]